MPLILKETLKSDQIDILLGYEGSESKETVAWSHNHEDDFPIRIVFAVNQNYPELSSGFYRNRRLVALVQQALVDIGLYVVIEDNYQEERIVPTELAGSLETGDDYLLVDATMKIHGRMNVWESLGGKSHFYHDNFIIEIVIGEKYCKELIPLVEQACQAKSIDCKHWGK